MTRQKKWESRQESRIKWQPWDSRQEEDISHPQPTSGKHKRHHSQETTPTRSEHHWQILQGVCALWGQPVLQEGQAEQWDERLSFCITMHLLIIPHLCRSSCLRTSKLCPSLPTLLTLPVWFSPHLKKAPHTTNSTPSVHHHFYQSLIPKMTPKVHFQLSRDFKCVRQHEESSSKSWVKFA